MGAFYNEIDPAAAHILRHMIDEVTPAGRLALQEIKHD